MFLTPNFYCDECQPKIYGLINNVKPYNVIPLCGKCLEIFKLESNPSSNDPVNKPSHYTDSKIEVLDAIEAWKLPYHLGQVIKYVARAGKKDKSKEIEDLEKAEFYLKRHIKNLKGLNVVSKV